MLTPNVFSSILSETVDKAGIALGIQREYDDLVKKNLLAQSQSKSPARLLFRSKFHNAVKLATDCSYSEISLQGRGIKRSKIVNLYRCHIQISKNIRKPSRS